MHKFENMLMKKLDDFAAYYENKELKDFSPNALDFMEKATNALSNIETVKAMKEYGGEYMDEMSGVPRRSQRTGRFVSRDGGMSGRMYPNRSYNDGSYDGSYNDGGSYDGSYNNNGSYGQMGSYGGSPMEAELEGMANNRSLPNSKREAAKKMLSELRKGDL